MKCCLSDLRYKEVIDLTTGQRLGYVCDAEIDLEQGKIVSLIVPGQKSSAVCSAAMTTTFCRGNPSPDWARISFSPRSRRSSRAAGGKSGRIISDSLKNGKIRANPLALSGFLWYNTRALRTGVDVRPCGFGLVGHN